MHVGHQSLHKLEQPGDINSELAYSPKQLILESSKFDNHAEKHDLSSFHRR